VRRKNVRVRHAIIANRVLQSFRDVPLPDKIAERLRPPLSRNDLIAHRKLLQNPRQKICKQNLRLQKLANCKNLRLQKLVD